MWWQHGDWRFLVAEDGYGNENVELDWASRAGDGCLPTTESDSTRTGTGPRTSLAISNFSPPWRRHPLIVTPMAFGPTRSCGFPVLKKSQDWIRAAPP